MKLLSFFKTLFGNKQPIKPERSFAEKCTNPEYDIIGHLIYIDSCIPTKRLPIEEYLRGDHDLWISERNMEWFEYYTSAGQLVLDQMKYGWKGGRGGGRAYILKLTGSLEEVFPQIQAGHFHEVVEGAWSFGSILVALRDERLTPESEKIFFETNKDSTSPKPQ